MLFPILNLYSDIFDKDLLNVVDLPSLKQTKNPPVLIENSAALTTWQRNVVVQTMHQIKKKPNRFFVNTGIDLE